MADKQREVRVLTPSRRDYVIEMVFMICAMGPVVVSAYVSYLTGNGEWFQRSGALMVLFSVAVEYHRRRIPGHIVRHVEPEKRRSLRNAWPARVWGAIPYVCYVAIFTGTLIWSYGDLLFWVNRLD